LKNKFSYFRFWLASKFIMLAVWIIDKNSFEGVSLVFLLRTWISQLITQIKSENPQTNTVAIINSLNKGSISNENKVNTYK
jgi:hypothetical protein